MTSRGSIARQRRSSRLLRRLEAESVGLVFAARAPSDQVAGLPELVVEGLREGDAHAPLDSVLTAPLDARVRDQIVAETCGNPLALLELLRERYPAGKSEPARQLRRRQLRAASRRPSGGGRRSSGPSTG
jgi:hypothetical protein